MPLSGTVPVLLRLAFADALADRLLASDGPARCYALVLPGRRSGFRVLEGSLARKYGVGLRAIFGQTGPPNPSRSTWLVLQCRLHRKSVRQTNSKAISWRQVLPGRRSGSRAGFRPDFLLGKPQNRSSGRPKSGGRADFEVFPIKSGRNPARWFDFVPEALLRNLKYSLVPQATMLVDYGTRLRASVRLLGGSYTHRYG